MSTVRVFSKPEDDQISIAGEVFDFKALPSGDAVRLTDMYSEGINFGKVVETLTNTFTEDMSSAQELSEVGKKVLDSRYSVISFGLGIKKDSQNYERLISAIDNAGFPEIFWVIDQILEINGVKRLEKMMKNLLSKVETAIPDVKEPLSRLLNQYLEDRLKVRELENQVKEIRSTGMTSFSPDSQESHSTSHQEQQEPVLLSKN